MTHKSQGVVRFFLPLILFSLACVLHIQTAEGASSVTLNPGDNVQAIVNAHADGTTYVFNPGVYRMQSITPHSNDVFTGTPGAILNGSSLITNAQFDGKNYYVTNQSQEGKKIGECLPNFPRCDRPEDLFFDNVPLTHVANLSDLGPGKWYFNYDNNTIYFRDNPAGHIVETSVTPVAFSGYATNVTIQGLSVQKYASPNQEGAIGGQYTGPSWIIKNNDVSLNHGAGIVVGSNTLILNNYVHHNGEKGIGGGGSNGMVIQGNEVAFNNNYVGVNCGWECGGIKIGFVTNPVFRANNVHDNLAGPGIWCDVECKNALIENNTATNNAGPGIDYEISYDGVIRNNVLTNNGTTDRSSIWWGANILVQNSSGTQVYGNTVKVGNAGDGILLVYQDRGFSSIGQAYVTKNNSITSNTITFTSSTNGVMGGQATDQISNLFSGSNNVFDYNIYHVASATNPYWHWGGNHYTGDTMYTFNSFKNLGFESHGSIDTNIGGVLPTDTQPPTTPSNLTGVAQSSSQVALSWSPSSDTVGVTGYKVFRNGAQLTTTSSTSYQDTSVSPNTTYSYAVAAYDAAGNTSSQSTSVSVTTPSVPAPTPAPTPVPTPTPTPVPVGTSCPAAANNAFTGCFYKGKNFDTFVLSRVDSQIAFNWGWASPDSLLPNTNYSAIWEGNFTFGGGTYIFSLTPDDGARLYIDGQLVLDKWVDQSGVTHTINKTISSGVHTIRLEYYQSLGEASVKLSWTPSTLTLGKLIHKFGYGYTWYPDEVALLQQFLVDKGYKTKVSGFFGNLTEQAVKEFQKDNNITNTGFVGSMTANVINSMMGR